jgi:hypothetical protein
MRMAAVGEAVFSADEAVDLVGAPETEPRR